MTDQNKKTILSSSTAWGIKNPHNRWSPIDVFTITHTRSQTVKKYLNEMGGRYTWKQLYRMGHRCIKVTIIEKP